jgi:hypothetical protein
LPVCVGTKGIFQSNIFSDRSMIFLLVFSKQSIRILLQANPKKHNSCLSVLFIILSSTNNLTVKDCSDVYGFCFFPHNLVYKSVNLDMIIVLFVTQLIFPSVQNANQSETPQYLWNSDWFYLKFVPPNGLEPQSRQEHSENQHLPWQRPPYHPFGFSEGQVCSRCTFKYLSVMCRCAGRIPRHRTLRRAGSPPLFFHRHCA